MRVLVTGASGYIGHHVCRELLARGWEVHAITRAGSDLRGLAVPRHDVDGSYASLAAAVASSKPEVVLHLASMVKARIDPSETGAMVEANIGFGSMLLEAMLAYGCVRFVNASTYWIYASDGTTRPCTFYAATKRAFEEIISFHACDALRATSLVIFDVYGANDWRPKLLTLLLKALASGERLRMSPADQRVDLVDVRDVARGFAVAAESLLTRETPGHLVRSLPRGEPRTLRSVIDLLSRLAAVPMPCEFGALPHPPFQIMEPVRSLTRLEGWEASIGLEQGLSELLAAARSSSRV